VRQRPVFNWRWDCLFALAGMKDRVSSVFPVGDFPVCLPLPLGRGPGSSEAPKDSRLGVREVRQPIQPSDTRDRARLLIRSDVFVFAGR